MKKRILKITATTLLALFAAACSRPKIIPDKELAHIFHDAFLTNSYVITEGVRIDSLNIYEPIFARYGYTTGDVQYTIGNFSKRKSARLGEVVQIAIDMLDAESKYYDREVSILDTVDNVARRTFTRTVLSDTLIRVGSLRDTSRLRFTLDVTPGEYNLRLNYLVDSLDRNTAGLRFSVWLERRDSSRADMYGSTLRRDRTEPVVRRFKTDSTHRRLHIDMLQFTARPQRPSVTVTDFEVTYVPPTALVVDSLYRKQLDIRIFADEFFRAAVPDATPAASPDATPAADPDATPAAPAASNADTHAAQPKDRL